MTFEPITIPQKDIFGAWGPSTDFYCADCCMEADVLFFEEDIVMVEAVQGSAAFFYCSACGERIQPETH